MRSRPLLLVMIAAALIVAPAFAVDWAQWRGPQRTGVSSEKGLADSWPAGGPKLIWQSKDLGDGYGSPAIAAGRIYLLGNDGLENEYVEARDVTSGKQIWRKRVGQVGEPDQDPNYPAARSTPTIDGDRIYALGSDGDMVCLATASGDILWQKNLRKDFNGKPGDWAYAESPLVDGEVVVCTPGGLDAAMVKLNKANGDVLWKCTIPEAEDAGYASAIIVNFEGRKQYVQYFSKGLVGIDAASGKFLWRALEVDRDNMATPIEEDGFVYIPLFLSGGGLAKLTSTADGVTAKEAYRKRGLPNSIGGIVLVDGHLYGTVTDGLVCADFKTGAIKWKAPSVGAGAVCSADGLLFVHGENSEVALVEATPTEYREKGRFKVPELPQRRDRNERAWSYPVVANGRLYIRDKNFLWCYNVADASETQN
ncbi:MAG: PQQ-binding-like beta-propeller repeat protein [Pirellulales bacterium]